MKKLNLEEVKAFIDAQSPETKIYLGVDSERFNLAGTWYADYVTAIVVGEAGVVTNVACCCANG